MGGEVVKLYYIFPSPLQPRGVMLISLCGEYVYHTKTLYDSRQTRFSRVQGLGIKGLGSWASCIGNSVGRLRHMHLDIILVNDMVRTQTGCPACRVQA